MPRKRCANEAFVLKGRHKLPPLTFKGYLDSPTIICLDASKASLVLPLNPFCPWSSFSVSEFLRTG